MNVYNLSELNHTAAEAAYLYVPTGGYFRPVYDTDYKHSNAHNVEVSGFHKGFTLTSVINSSGIWTPAADKKFVVTDIQLSIDGTTNAVLFHEGASETNSLMWVARYRGGTKTNVNTNFVTPYVAASGGSTLYIRTETSSEVMGVIHGYEKLA